MNDMLRNTTLRSTLTEAGQIELHLQDDPVPPPRDAQILVRIEAAPVNPTDLALMLGGADLDGLTTSGKAGARRVTIPLPPVLAAAHHRRRGLAICPGLEGAGIVVAAGQESRHLIGKTVSVFGGAMFARYRIADPADCIVFPEGTPPERVATSFVNPLTALAMIETMRLEGHRAIIHTAAASNLGRMLERLCAAEGIALINILRNEDSRQKVLADGARHALNSTAPDFKAHLIEAIRQTDASLAFDAIGGGDLAGRLLAAMEEVFAPPPEHYSVYGSARHKQVYVYGGLTPGPIVIPRGFGSAWSVSGWLMMNRLATFPPATVAAMKARVARDIDTTFRSTFSATIGLADLLDPSRLRTIRMMKTGQKVLLRPQP